MVKQFFPNLSQNYIEILDDEYYDITIEVGEDPNKNDNDGALTRDGNGHALTHVKLSNISPEIFQIILKYIYGGVISLNDQEPSEILKILVAADQLFLQELIDYLQKYLIENKSEWIKKNLNLFIEQKKFLNHLILPLPEKSLVSLINKDDLVEIWEHVLKWGLQKNPTIHPDPTTWSVNDFKMIENTLQYCLPLIRFFSLSSDEFIQKVHPYKKLLKH
ncbi:BTB/POZ protein [Rhizophagus irregularis DAOM 181602=DAOM 197198]|uniref:BTB domain-containing protein n=1 Tax=Rhizophagus irregularis (strain DAOM 181602 / DAOM 197198 / MUCL 43194) TaxID=747089 RepID=A0A2P4Q3V2_RHIID|nr:hypothetical protein GLOIN_2v1773816 [Rhizophagus irregularis DAOM 181602=DAOM 197198]POG72296.1 hypothetical protein GLOIN_2v1773816 [Rhizophagus irregularis DAOM 181602=DAOM 197198]GET64930.1 BTB/POZ protein [Rhizophagus irregularis DAOM 181602=DAOM 197198]|eukprot:XP_025179162.1 hypothetical protein GLOIN_2v1773816 [Rhizophagus irregularis DAOM 181602=DAOM 197198]